MDRPPDPRAHEQASGSAAGRVGIITQDALRLEGLKAICSDTLHAEIVPMPVGGGMNASGLGLILIDAETTPQLFEVIAALRSTHPAVKLLVLGNATAPEFVERIVGAGAKGYLALSAPEPEVRMALQIVRDGSVWAPRKVLSRLLDRGENQSQPAQRAPSFTARERDVLELLHAGRSNREIAQALRIDESTVKAHVGRLMRKVGVKNRIALTMHPLTRLP